MIWMFMAGFIAGAVGWSRFVLWMGEKIRKKQMMESFRKTEEKTDDRT